MSRLEILVPPEEIKVAVGKLARRIEEDYQGRNLLVLGALKGCFVFMADLLRDLQIPVEIEFVMLSSYGRGRRSSTGRVKLVRGLNAPVKGRDILIVEDIVDTGLSLDFLLNYLEVKKPASIRICTLFDKPSCRKVAVPLDYVGITVPDKFVVGYGLDYDEKYRNLPCLYMLDDEC